MNGLLLSPLGPALLLLTASILLRIFASVRRSSILALLALLPLGLTLLLLLAQRNAPGGRVVQIAWWPVVVAPLDVQWALDGWNWINLVLLTLVTAAAVLLTWRAPGKRAGAVQGLSMLFAAAAALTVVSDNLLTLSGAWVATDITLLAVGRARSSQRSDTTAPVWLEVSGSLLVLVAIGITSLRAASAPLSIAQLPPETVILLLLAALIRMAAYPLHLWMTPNSVATDRGIRLLLNGIGMITGAWLLGRLAVLGAATWLADPVWIPVFTVLALAGGLAAWLSKPEDRFSMLASARGIWLWLVVAAAPAAISRDALGWGLSATVLSLMLLAVGAAIREQWGWRLPLLLAAVTMAGLPLTVGMPAYALADPPNPLAWLLWLVVNALAVATVFLTLWQPDEREKPAERETLAASRLNWPVIRLLSALALCLIPIALWGVQPAAFARSAGFGTVASQWELLRMLGVSGLIGVAATLLLGWGLAQLPGVQPGRAADWQARIGYAVGLAWLLQGGRWLFTWVEVFGRTGFRIFEGEGYLGWVILLGLAAWLVYRL